MMDKKSFALGVALLAGASAASAEGLGISVNAGLVGLGLGAGADITYSVNPMMNVRAGFMQGKQSTDTTIDSNDFSITSKTSTMGVYVDWLIFQGDFRMTAGYVANNGSINLSAPSGASVDFAGTPVTIDTFSGEISFAASPYVGIGWGNAAESGDTFGFNVDVGVFLDSKPTVNIDATTSPATDISAEIAALENDMTSNNTIKTLPVITVGMTYHF